MESNIFNFNVSMAQDSIISVSFDIDFDKFAKSGLPNENAINMNQTFSLCFKGILTDNAKISIKDKSAKFGFNILCERGRGKCTLFCNVMNFQIHRGEIQDGSVVRSRKYYLANFQFSLIGYKNLYKNKEDFHTIKISTKDVTFTLFCSEYNPQCISFQNTSTLLIVAQKPLSSSLFDFFANSFCELLSFATRNTISWIKYEDFIEDNQCQLEYFITRRLFPYRFEPLIEDCDLLNFLNQTLPTYLTKLEEWQITRVIALLMDGLKHDLTDVKFMLTFMALVRLRTKIQKEMHLSKNVISESFITLIEKDLGINIINLIDNFIPNLNDKQKEIIIKQLRSADNPTEFDEMTAFCKNLNVSGFSKDMIRYRNDLIHVGRPPKTFSEEKKHELYIEIAKILDQCLLRVLHYQGRGYSRRDI